MALAVEAARMGAHDESSIHPFFAFVKDKSNILKGRAVTVGRLSPLRSNASRTAKASSHQLAPAPAPPNKSELEAEDTDISSSSVPVSSKSSRSRRSGKEVDLQRQQRIPRSSRRSEIDERKRVNAFDHSSLKEGTTILFTQNDATPQNLVDVSSDEVDFDDRQGKRRRTISPRNLSYVTALDVQSNIESRNELLAGRADTNDGMTATPPKDGNPTGKLVTLFRSQSSQGSDNQARHRLLAQASPPVVEESFSSEEQPTLREFVPTRRMLRLRSDGKLVSPKARIGAGVKKTKASEKLDLTRIISLRYGMDKDSKTEIGQKINAILTNTASAEKVLQAMSRAGTSSSKLPGPLKPTHPFFRGKITRTSSGDSMKAAKDTVPENGLQVKNFHNSSLKRNIGVGGDAARAWAALGGYGHKAFASDFAKVARFPGAVEPLWPPRDMQHARGLSPAHSVRPKVSTLGRIQYKEKKLKGKVTQISLQQDVLFPLRKFYENLNLRGRTRVSRLDLIQKPQRHVLTGIELQEALRPRVVSKLPTTYDHGGNKISNSSLIGHSNTAPAHDAVLHMFKDIASSTSAFDRHQCENQDWVQKYAPSCAGRVLQQGREATLLRDWLKSLTVNLVDTGHTPNAQVSSGANKKINMRAKKKRRRAEELDGFVVTSDEEADEMDELTDPEDDVLARNKPLGIKRSVVRTGDISKLSKSSKISNAIVISGPHGCGKTAAVYAVAKELGFEVFEVNAGSRRSGRDLLDRVGDVARNHLVRQSHSDEQIFELDGHISAAFQQDIDTGRQSTMQSFMKAGKKLKGVSGSRSRLKTVNTEIPESTKKLKQQKQSLILLEEVDILFEEDKQFWSTVLGLILQSRRPIIMTCTDETRLPLNEMTVHAIFRLTPPPEQLAVDYLILLAGNEGHLISRESTGILYRSKNYDLRASITELNFWCQMGIGDTGGGLDWMLISSDAEALRGKEGKPLRVVSESTYNSDIGSSVSNGTFDPPENMAPDELLRLFDSLDPWNRDDQDIDGLLCAEACLAYETKDSARYSLKNLHNYDLISDAMSAADVLPGLGLEREDKIYLNASEPDLTETAARLNFTEGLPLLQADSVADQTNKSALILLALKACAWNLHHDEIGKSASPGSLIETVQQRISDNRCVRSSYRKTKSLIPVAFKALEEGIKPTAFLALPKSPQITGFDGPSSIIAEDIAPYVRAIVSYDMRLEEQRLQLSSLLSQGGRNGKRQRTTRASRAALEGGSKANTRRERWFPPQTNFPLVLQTGGKGWQTMAAQRQQLPAPGSEDSESDCSSYERSRRPSLATVSSDD